MDWEQDVNCIVRETGETLAKIKEKIHGKMNVQEADKYHVSTYQSRRESSGGRDYVPELSVYSHTQTAGPAVHADADFLHSSHSHTMHLQEKLDVQCRTIEHLNKLVKYLESERDLFAKQIEELTVAIKELTRGSMEERSSSEMKQQISRMKSEVAREMETLRNQLMTFRANAIHPSPAFMSSHVPSRDGRDMHSSLQEELHYLRRDLDFLKSRIDSVESNVLSFSGYQTTQKGPPETYLNDYDLRRRRRKMVETLTTLPLADKNLKKTCLQELRHSVSSLKNKLDLVEGKVDRILPQSSPKNGYGYSHYSLQDDIDSTDDGDDDDDIDVGDDEDDDGQSDVDDVDIIGNSDSDSLSSANLADYHKVSTSTKHSKDKDENSDTDSLSLDDLDLDDCDSRLSATDEDDSLPEK